MVETKNAHQIVYKSPNDLIQYEFNNKVHDEKQIDMICNSISEMGFANPILVDKNNIIIAWHGRHLAAKKLLLQEVPCIVVDWLTEKQIKKLRIIDNRIGDFAKYDKQSLKIELTELGDPELFDMFVGWWLEADDDKEEKEDDVPSIAPEDVIVRKGHMFRLWSHYLLCGDSTDPNDVKTLMGEVTADLIFTDPPYNVNYKWTGKKTSRTIENDNMSFQEFDTFLDKTFANYAKVLKAGGGAYIFHSTSTQAQFQKYIEKNWFEIKNQLIRNKPTAAMWWSDYRRKHEPFFYCGIKSKEIKFYGDRTHTTIIDIHKDKTDKEILNLIKHTRKAESEWMTTVRSIWRDKVSEYVHPTQKPVQLIQVALTNSSKMGDIVVDFFQWSWATMIACEKLQRVCYWIELDPFFVQTIIARYHYYTNWEKEIVCLNDKDLSIKQIIDGREKKNKD